MPAGQSVHDPFTQVWYSLQALWSTSVHSAGLQAWSSVCPAKALHTSGTPGGQKAQPFAQGWVLVVTPPEHVYSVPAMPPIDSPHHQPPGSSAQGSVGGGGGHSQSPGQVAHRSPPLHSPSPHEAGHCSQSAAQEKQSSPRSASQVPSPHASQTPQSAGHVEQSSATSGSQVPSPHASHAPHSAGHDAHDSPCATSQLPLPHSAQSVQGRQMPSSQISPAVHTPPGTHAQSWAPGMHGVGPSSAVSSATPSPSAPVS